MNCKRIYVKAYPKEAVDASIHGPSGEIIVDGLEMKTLTGHVLNE